MESIAVKESMTSAKSESPTEARSVDLARSALTISLDRESSLTSGARDQCQSVSHSMRISD